MKKNWNYGGHERGNVLLVAIIGAMMAMSIVLWVSELSLRNFKSANDHMYREEAFFAAQGAADAIAAEFDEGFKAAAKALADADPSKPPLDFITWLEGNSKYSNLKQNSLPDLVTPKVVSRAQIAEWSNKKFNGSEINLARVDRSGSGSAGHRFRRTTRDRIPPDERVEFQEVHRRRFRAAD
jgi:hypothetical protein